MKKDLTFVVIGEMIVPRSVPKVLAPKAESSVRQVSSRHEANRSHENAHYTVLISHENELVKSIIKIGDQQLSPSDSPEMFIR